MAAPPLSINPIRLKASILRDDYVEYVKWAWPIIVPEQLVWNWHMTVICRKLQYSLNRVLQGLPCENDLLFNVPPGTSKPVWEEMSVLMSDGKYKKLKEIVAGDFVIGKSGDSCRVLKVHKQGELESVRIKTEAGRLITTALDHPILTAEGWKSAGEILEGDTLALLHSPKTIKFSGTRKLSEFILAGYFIGDGCTKYLTPSFCGSDEEYLSHFRKHARRMNFRISEASRLNKKTGVCTSIINLRNGKGVKVDRAGCARGEKVGMAVGGPRYWMAETGMAGKGSREKRVPSFIWEGTNKQIAAFLAAYFHCDGSVFVSDTGKSISISMVTISKGLAKDIQRLLLRLGVSVRFQGRVSNKGFVYNRTLVGYRSYCLYTFDKDEIAKFAQIVPIRGYKGRALQHLKLSRFSQTYLPDKVVKVGRIGKRKCRCLTVEKDKSFVVDGVVVHNSLLCSVLPAGWMWANNPTMKLICASYSHELSLDLSRKARLVVESDQYRETFPHVRLAKDQNTKSLFATQEGGWRYATSLGGSVMGKHGHAIILDDIVDPKRVASAAELDSANKWVSEEISTRKVDKISSLTVLVMQRLGVMDPAGVMIERGNCDRIVFPGEDSYPIFPPEYKKKYKDGLLDPKRLPRKILDQLKKTLGKYGYAAQIGNSPLPAEGGQFVTDRFRRDGPFPVCTRFCRFWDKAGTLGGGNYTTGVLLGADKENRFRLYDMVRVQLDSFARDELMLSTAKQDGKDVLIGLEQEGGSGGKQSVEISIRKMAGFNIKKIKPNRHQAKGGKAGRADPWSVQVNAGNVWITPGHWNKDLIDEHTYFPFGNFDDVVDACVGAFSLIAQPHKRRVGGMTPSDKFAGSSFYVGG